MGGKKPSESETSNSLRQSLALWKRAYNSNYMDGSVLLHGRNFIHYQQNRFKYTLNAQVGIEKWFDSDLNSLHLTGLKCAKMVLLMLNLLKLCRK